MANFMTPTKMTKTKVTGSDIVIGTLTLRESSASQPNKRAISR
jgi:hypothetical protein